METTQSTKSQKKRSLWRNRDFVILWSGQAASVLGTRISSLALPLLVLDITHSPLQAGLLSSARMVPYLVLGLPAGALVDRWNRKTTMIVCDLARAIALGCVPLAWTLGFLSLAQLYAVALIQGAAFVFFNVAEMASLPNVVPEEDLPQALALDSLAGSAGALAGPGLAGFIIGAARTTGAGAVLAYFIDALTYLASVVSLLWIRVPFQVERLPEREKPLQTEVMEGLHFLWNNKPLRAMALTSWMLSLLYAPVSLAMIVLARGELGASPRAIGLIFSLSAVGGILGASIAPRLKARFSSATILIASVAVQAVATLAVGFAPSTLVMTLGWAVAFACDPIFTAVSSAYRLSVTPDDLQGRVQSVYRMGGYGAEPLGTALGGLALGVVGARAEINAVAGSVGLLALLLLLGFRAVLAKAEACSTDNTPPT